MVTLAVLCLAFSKQISNIDSLEGFKGVKSVSILQPTFMSGDDNADRLCSSYMKSALERALKNSDIAVIPDASAKVGVPRVTFVLRGMIQGNAGIIDGTLLVEDAAQLVRNTRVIVHGTLYRKNLFDFCRPSELIPKVEDVCDKASLELANSILRANKK